MRHRDLTLSRKGVVVSWHCEGIRSISHVPRNEEPLQIKDL